MKICVIAALLSVSLTTVSVAAPAAVVEKAVTTPSGRAEMVFGYTTLTDAVTAVQSECMDKGWMVVSQTGNQVVCEVPMGVWQSALTQMMIGNSYSTTPKQFARFSLAQTGEHTRVQTQVWAETQMAFGQMQQHQYTDDGTYDNMLGFMTSAGAQLPVGSTFTGAAYLGIDGENTTIPNGRRTAYAHRLKTVIERAPGYRMGLRSGDLVTKINNRALRDEAAFVTALDRQRVGRPMTITVVRDGVEQVLTGNAEGRPAITMLVRPGDIPAGETAVAWQMGVATLGSFDAAMAAWRDANPQAGQTKPVDTVPSQNAETELDRMRREAAEAQARLAAAEAAAAPATAATAPE